MSQSSSGPILVVAAFPPELKALASLLRARAQRGAPAVARAVVGVGLVEAAAGAARAVALLEPRAVVLVGTAGVYPTARRPRPAIGTAVLVRRAHLASLAVASGAAYLPEPMPPRGGHRRRAAPGPAGRRPHPAVDVACPLGITRTRAAATALARPTWPPENLETFAVARACAEAAIPFAAVLGITNQVGPQAHQRWQGRRSRPPPAPWSSR